MKTIAKKMSRCQLAAREPLSSTEGGQLWRVKQGVLRIDSGPAGETVHFVRLALPGDVLGVEHWAGGEETLRYRALIACVLEPVNLEASAMVPILMDTVVVAHQRSREAMELRTGPVAQRLKSLLLMFAQGQEPMDANAVECQVPNLADLHDILDAAPETISRVFGNMRGMSMLQDRRPQKASFSSQALRKQTLMPGMSASSSLLRNQLASA